MYSDKNRIGRAFRALKRLKYETQAGKWCCSSCATSDFDTNRFVFYHRQDAERFDEFGDIPENEKVYIGHGEDGDGYEVIRALHDQGLITVWDGSINTRIAVMHNGRISYTHPEVA